MPVVRPEVAAFVVAAKPLGGKNWVGFLSWAAGALADASGSVAPAQGPAFSHFRGEGMGGLE